MKKTHAKYCQIDMYQKQIMFFTVIIRNWSPYINNKVYFMTSEMTIRVNYGP